MLAINYQLEKHFKNVGSRPQRKHEETITTFNRDIFFYNIDTVGRQNKPSTKVITYEDHRKAVETAVNMMRKESAHDIAMCILTNRYFEEYRNNVFAGKGDFNADYGFLVKKIGMLFNHTTSRINPSSIAQKLREFTKPALVQVNHITGTVSKVTTPSNNFTLAEWAIKYNANAVESSTYQVAGLKIGA